MKHIKGNRYQRCFECKKVTNYSPWYTKTICMCGITLENNSAARLIDEPSERITTSSIKIKASRLESAMIRYFQIIYDKQLTS